MVKPVDYKQNDCKWGGLPYAVDGEKSTIKSAGCGPTSLADVLAAIVSTYIDPVTLAAWARYHNYKVKNSGTSYSFFVPCAKEYGVTVRRLNTANVYGKSTNSVHEQASAELQNGNWIIACMGKGLWTSSGHYIVVYGAEGGKVYINDPASSSAARACNSWQTFISQVKYYWVVEVPDNIKKSGIVKDGAYRQEDFVREVQFCTGATPDGKPGTEALSKTVTVSKIKNRTHFVVMPLQKIFKKQGRYNGKIDKVAGKMFEAAVNSYQENILKYVKPDGEITARGKMWKSLLGIK
ncbi:MAG: C39 family peptidase [Lachnospiraceae bacterium]